MRKKTTHIAGKIKEVNPMEITSNTIPPIDPDTIKHLEFRTDNPLKKPFNYNIDGYDWSAIKSIIDHNRKRGYSCRIVLK